MTDLKNVVEPLRERPLLLSEYLEATANISVEEINAALELKLLHAIYPPGGPEPVVYLLKAGYDLLSNNGLTTLSQQE